MKIKTIGLLANTVSLLIAVYALYTNNGSTAVGNMILCFVITAITIKATRLDV